MITIVISKSDIVTNVTVNAQGIRSTPDYTAHKQSHNWPGSGPGPSACRSLSGTPLTGWPQGRTATYIPAQGVKQRNGTGRRSRWGDPSRRRPGQWADLVERTPSVGTQITCEFFADFCPMLNGQIRLPTTTTFRTSGPVTFQISY